MWYKKLNLLRYLFVFRVNSPLVWFPSYPSAEFSIVLGNCIAERLPTTEARHWRKSLKVWDSHEGMTLNEKRHFRTLPENPWPVETVLMPYPGKRCYGKGELIFFELKLLGDSADHRLILEILLPALEEVGAGSDSRWNYNNCLWGHFDVHALYIADAGEWKPLVSGGYLDLSYRPDLRQWAKGMRFQHFRRKSRDRLTWLTPFQSGGFSGKKRLQKKDKIPSLPGILDALALRMAVLMSGKKYASPDDFYEMLSTEEQKSFREARNAVSHIPVIEYKADAATDFQMGLNRGTQVFSTVIPDTVCPYIAMASVVHIGEHSHFGWGTFVIE